MSAPPWTCEFHTYFWHPREPFQVKFWVEKTTSVLLEREDHAGKLGYAGRAQFAPHFYRVALTFEAAFPDRNLYSLRLAAETPAGWTTPERQHEDAGRAFRHWLRDAQTTAAPAWSAALADAYAGRVRAAVEQEEQARAPHDPGPVAELQRAILQALAAGRHFATAHKEGGTVIRQSGDRFVSQEYGESDERRVFAQPAEFLEYLRNFYDWESRRDTYPHRPPEVEVWTFIQSRLRE